MTYPNPLWSAILAYPHDDEPRLRLAHWLDERDHPRGEFIRLQCQLDKLPLANPLRLELEAREHELLADHEREWLGELDALVDWAVFQRGFPSEISTSCDAFLRHGERIMSLAPIQMVHLAGARNKADDLARCAALRRVSFLDLSNNHLRDQGTRILAESPNLANLEGLNLSSIGLGDAGAKALAASKHLVGLRELYLCDNRITYSGLRVLAESPLVGQLEVLSLRFNVCTNGRDLLRADSPLSLMM
jgi:uncharacterized protein (TIGR02996 family)